MKQLILGSNGFVGSNYINYLKRKDTKYQGLARSADIDFLNKSFDPVYVSQFDAVINFVGKAHDTKGTVNIQLYREANVDYLIKSYEAFLKSEAKVYIYLSSVKAVADSVDGYLTEEHIPKPQTIYGKTKLEGEDYIMSNLPDYKSVYILRPCMIHGPGNKGNLNLLHSIISRGIPWPLGSYDNSRSFLSIDNLCYVIKEILEGKVSSGIYNVSDDEALSTNDLVSIIAEISKKRSQIWHIPQPIIKLIAKAGNILPIPLNEERLEKLTENYVVSNNKLKNELRIVKMPVSAKEGLFKTLNHFESL
jgi:nucleoside-diphosphate-sugar epimerase